MSLTVAAPGVGKSMVWLNLAVRMDIPTLYWSADTDQHDVMMRSLALITKGQTTDIDEWYGSSEKTKAYYDDALRGVDHIDWIFDSAIPAERVAERLSAFAELHGEYPHLVVLDNISNAVQHQSDSFAEQNEFVVEVQKLARFTRSHFAILAHAKGEYENGSKPIPQGGVLNNLAKLPEVVLTLHRANSDGSELGLNVAKNRGGRADPSAVRPVILPVDYSTAYVGGAK